MTVEGGWGLAWLTGSGAVTSSWDSWEGDSPALLPCQIYPLGLKGENIWEKIGHIEGKRSGSYGPVYNVHVSRGVPGEQLAEALAGTVALAGEVPDLRGHTAPRTDDTTEKCSDRHAAGDRKQPLPLLAGGIGAQPDPSRQL